MSSCMLVKYIPFLFVGKYLYIFVYEYERHVYMILCKDIWMPVCNAWFFMSECVYIFVLKLWSEKKLVCVSECDSIVKVNRNIKLKSLHV